MRGRDNGNWDLEDPSITLGLAVLLAGFAGVMAILIKAGSKRLGVPEVLGFLLLGFGLKLLDEVLPVFNGQETLVFRYLAELGIAALLFRVGLESNLLDLMATLRAASLIWLGNVTITAAISWWAARALLGLDGMVSAVVATAMTCTSVAIPVRIWQDNNALETPIGRQFIDVAELDDISGVLMLALLFAVLPVYHAESDLSLTTVLIGTGLDMLLKMAGFLGVCYLFARYAERPMTSRCYKFDESADPVILVWSCAIIISAIAELLGFSMAIGAFFAGLIFSRDPQRVNIGASFSSFYDLFTPFFFVGIGLMVEPASLTGALLPGVILMIVSIIGKLAGTTIPALLTSSWTASLLLGVSMIPRGEIFLVIAVRGHEVGEWAMPDSMFGAMVFVGVGTCVITPMPIEYLIKRYRAELDGPAAA